MAAAIMPADDGHQGIVLERDAELPPPRPKEAFGDWDRRTTIEWSMASAAREQLSELVS